METSFRAVDISHVADSVFRYEVPSLGWKRRRSAVLGATIVARVRATRRHLGVVINVIGSMLWHATGSHSVDQSYGEDSEADQGDLGWWLIIIIIWAPTRTRVRQVPGEDINPGVIRWLPMDEGAGVLSSYRSIDSIPDAGTIEAKRVSHEDGIAKAIAIKPKTPYVSNHVSGKPSTK